VWQEDGKYPNVIVELLSDSTATTDRGAKKRIYQDVFRTPEYFWFSPHTLEFQGFLLVGGNYEAIEPNERGHLWSEQMQLFLGVENEKLRFLTPEGKLVPTPEEAAEMAQKQNEKMAAKLRELGIDPEQL
jgi:Uma2 family endonuclease